MDYEDVSEDNLDPTSSDDIVNDDSGEISEDNEIEELEEIEKKGKKPSQADQHTQEVRRAIEDRLEQTKMRKEFDYLFDDDFADEDEEGDVETK